MEGKKPYYDVGFWVFVFEKEESRFMDFVRLKANKLRVLEAKDLCAMPEQEAKQVQRQITALNAELNTLYGYKLFVAEMRNCYAESIDKVYKAYSNRNRELEIENHQLRQENFRLAQGFRDSIDETLFYMNYSMDLLKQNGQNEKQYCGYNSEQ